MDATIHYVDDEELWGLVQHGDPEAFELIVRRHQGMVAGVAYNACGDLALSEDVAQEVFWAAWRGRASLLDPSRLRPWLCGIARNLGANAARRASARTTVGPMENAPDLAGQEPEPIETALRREEELLIWNSLADIPEAYREPLILFYRQDQSVAEVAAALDLSEDAVKQRLSRGRTMLRDRLANLVEEGLRRSKPGRTFTAGVMAGLGLAGASKTAAAATGTTSQAIVAAGSAGALLGILGGFAGSWLGAWLPAQAAPTIRERDLLLRCGRRMLIASAAFLSVLLLLARYAGGTSWYLMGWLGAMFGFQGWVFYDVWKVNRKIRDIRADDQGSPEVNRTAVRRGMAVLARRVQGRVYRSRLRLFGLPLIDVQVADPPSFTIDGAQTSSASPRRLARGWIAVGDDARGVVLAIGDRAIGGIAVGGVALGLASFGGASVGIVSCGGVTAGLATLGGVAVGAVAVGGLAIGKFAAGGAAMGWDLAVGGFAAAWDVALGGAAFGHHPIPQGAAARWLAGRKAGFPILDGWLAGGFRWFLTSSRTTGLVLTALALAMAALKTSLMYRRRTAGGPEKQLLLAALIASQFGCSPPSPTGPETYRLDNGLRVLLRPIAGATQTGIVVLYDIGGDHDPEGKSGLAHLVEHVYTTAKAGETPSRTAAEFLARYAAGWNAQTGDRYTVVATVTPANHLDAELREAAARMADLTILEEDLRRERPRVQEEVANMFQRIPALAAMNNAREIVRPTPSGGRRGGRPDHLGQITLGDVQDHWRRYYKPRNALISLAGALDVAAARAAIERYFAAIPAGDAPPPPGEMPALPAKRETSVAGSHSGPATVATALAPPQPGDPLYLPYAVLGAGLLKAGSDPSAGVQVYMPVLDDPGALIVSTAARAGESPEQASRRLDGWLTRHVDAQATPAESDEMRAMLGFFLGTAEIPDQALGANPYGVAFAAGRRTQLGVDPARMKAALEAVDAEALNTARIKVFAQDRRGVAIVHASQER